MSVAPFTASAESLSPVVITGITPATDGSNNLVINGRVPSTDGIASLNINGYAPSSFDGQNFSLQMPPAQAYQIHLYGADGSYQLLDYVAPNTPVDSAVQVVVGNQLLQDVGPALAKLLANLDINALLGLDPNKCAVDTLFLAGCDLYINKLAIQGTPNVRMFFSQSKTQALTINIQMDIPRAVISTKLKRALWFGHDVTTVTTDNIQVAFQIGVKATANQSIKLVLDQASDVQLRLGTMKIQSNNLAAYLLPLIKDGLTAFVNTHLANLAGPLLAKLPIPAIPLTLPLDIDGDSVADAKFAIKMGAEKLAVLSSGDGQATLKGSISAAEVAEGRAVLGTRRIASLPPAAQGVTAPTDLTAAISTNLVNEVLTAVYQSGIDQKLAIPLKVSDLGSFGSYLPLFGYGLNDQLNIRLKFGASPELQVNADSQYPLGLEMILPNMQMVMSAVTANGEEVILDMTGDYLVATSLGAETTGQLHLQFANLLKMENVAINGGKFAELFPPNLLQALIPGLLPQVVSEYEPMIAELLNAPRLELDIGQLLNSWLKAKFPSVPVAGYVTEASVNDDESYLQIGLGIDFP